MSDYKISVEQLIALVEKLLLLWMKQQNLKGDRKEGSV